MPTILENLVNDLNQVVFYREFSFGRNEFLKEPGVTREFADHVVWIGDLMIIFQVKEREHSADDSADAEKKWFDRKVLGKATRQIRDTLGYLQSLPSIPITNQRGHIFDLHGNSVSRVLKLILYKASDLLPEECRRVRHYVSSTGGFMHVLPWQDYQGVCGILLTPTELVEYFQFREQIVTRSAYQADLPSETGLLGQFLSGDLQQPPSESFGVYLERLKHDPSEFEPGPLLRNLGEKIEKCEGPEGELGYYRILTEFAKLARTGLKQASIRFSTCLEAVSKDEFYQPTRFVSVETGCGFIFIAVPPEKVRQRLNGLKVFTLLSKYDMKTDIHVGVSFAKEGADYLIDWILIDSPWEEDSESAEMLRQSYPFRETKPAEIKRYHFR